MVLHKFILCSFGAGMDLPRPYQEAKLRWLSYTWGLYVTGLVVSTIIVFATVVDNMDKESLLGLKVTLWITPILLLLLLNTATEVKDHEELLPSLYFEMAVDLVNTIEILDIPLNEDNDLENKRVQRRTAIWRYIVEMIVENLTFLVIRLVIVFKYKKDESIFLAKNGIAFVLGFMGIRDLMVKDDVNSREETGVHEQVAENVVEVV